MKYSAWSNNDNTEITLVEGITKPIHDKECEVFLYEIEANDWTEANTIHHEKQGWGKYIPMEEE